MNIENCEIVKILIEKGANVNALDSYESTPLHYAARYNNSGEAVKILIERGANVNALNIDELTPLDYAAIYN